MTDYTRIANTAHKLIRKAGADGVLLQAGKAVTYDVNTATATPSTGATESPMVAVAIDYAQDFIDGTLILTGDKQMFMSPLVDATPKAGDKVRWPKVGGKVYAVVSAKLLAPAGLVVLHEMQIRG